MGAVFKNTTASSKLSKKLQSIAHDLNNLANSDPSCVINANVIQLQKGKPALILAPMEGVTDAPMRALLTELGGYAFCVSEFYRISQDVPRARKIARHVPELRKGGRTFSNTPVQVQFLGGDAEKLAESARRACLVGALGIDLNFGCPAPTVNRHDGGATLLKFPERIHAIVSTVRKAVPKPIAVSAKLRLGWDDMGAIHHNADRAAEAGASWITIHGRTKMQGYKPPAFWGPIGEVRRRLEIPVVANGEIWTLDDFKRCRDETGCEHFMLGRSALADPTLVHQIAKELGASVPQTSPMDWTSVFGRFNALCDPLSQNQNYVLCRLKRWLTMIGYQTQRQTDWIAPLKRAATLEEFFLMLRSLVAGRG